jgi:hypothetical protein
MGPWLPTSERSPWSMGPAVVGLISRVVWGWVRIAPVRSVVGLALARWWCIELPGWAPFIRAGSWMLQIWAPRA